MKSTMQFLQIIGCITLLTLGTLALVNACFSNFWIVNGLTGISENLKESCTYTPNRQG